MIILLTMLYAFLASGGYLESLGSWENYGSWENISSGLFNFQNVESTTTTTITLKPIQKQTQKVQNKINSKRAPRKHINNVFLSTKIPVKIRNPRRQRRPTTKAGVRNGIKSSKSAPTTKIHTTTTTIPIYKDTIEIVELGDSDVMQQINAISDTTTDVPLQATHVTKYIEKCPEEGFFFKNDLQSASRVCYLCFCKENTTAVCWPRDNRRCDAESYQHNLARKRLSRNRRSFDFGNLFMQNAARDALNANGKKQCKPGEASYSVGCPPEDWCVGCTVCDCDINAKWNCHLLSFCTDDNKTKQNKKGHQTPRPYDPFTTPKAWRAQRKLAQEAVQKLAEKMAAERKKKAIGKDNSRRYFFKNGTLVNKTIFDLRKRKKSPSIFDQTSAEVQRFTDVNMKIRKIPDEIQKQMMIDRQQNNAKKVSESANFLVRNMPNQKAKQKIVWKQTQAVNLLAKREPQRKKKRQVLLPSGYKLPKEILDKLPEGVLPPSKDPPGDRFPKMVQVKRVLNDKKISATKPPKKITKKKLTYKNSFQLPSEGSKKVLVKRSTKLEQPKNQFKEPTGNQFKGPGASIQRTKQTKINHSQNKESKGKLGIKEQSKKRNVPNINMKISEKRNMNTNKNANYLNTKKGSEIKSKLKEQSIKRSMPNNNMKISEKRNLKTNKDSNKWTTKKGSETKTNIKSKKPDKKMSLTSKAKTTRKNLKTTIPKKNNNQKKVTKVIPKPKVVVKKSIQNEKDTKKLIANNNRRKNTLQTDKNSKNPLTKLGKNSVRKSNIHGPKVINTRNKRSNNSKKTAKANNIDRKRLNEHINKLTTNAQVNLNRRVLEVVGNLLGQNLNQQSKKVKRSAIVNKNSPRGRMSDELISDSSIESSPPVLIAPNRNNKNIEYGIDNGDYEDVNQTSYFKTKYDTTSRSVMKNKVNRNKREISTNSSQVIPNVITVQDKLKLINVQMHINISPKNTNSEMNANIPNETNIESSSTVVQKPIVIKNDNTVSTKSPPFILNTEHNMELTNFTKMSNSSKDLITSTTQDVKAYGNETSLVFSKSFSTLTISPVIDINTSHKIVNTSSENGTKCNDKIKYDDNVEIIKGNDYKPQQHSLLDALKNYSTINETSSNHLQYKVNTKTLKQQYQTTGTLTTPKIINEQTIHDTKTSVKDYLKRKIETKTFNFNPTVTVSLEPKQPKILQSNGDINENLKPNYDKKEYPYPDNKAYQISQDYTETSLAAKVDSIKSLKGSSTELVKSKNKKFIKQMGKQRKAQDHRGAKQKNKSILVSESQNKNSRGELSLTKNSKNVKIQNINTELSENRKKKTNKNRNSKITKNHSKKTNQKSKAKNNRKKEEQLSKLSYLNNARKSKKDSKNIFSKNDYNYHKKNFTKVNSKNQDVNRRKDLKNNLFKNNYNYRQKNDTVVLTKHEEVIKKSEMNEKYTEEQKSKLTNFNSAKKARKNHKNIFSKINNNYHKKNVTKVILKNEEIIKRKGSKNKFSKNNNNYRKTNYTKVLTKDKDVIKNKDSISNFSKNNNNYRENNDTEILPKHEDITEKSTKDEKYAKKLKSNKRKKNAVTTDKNLKINKPLIKLRRHFLKKSNKRGPKLVSNAEKRSDIANKPNIIERKRIKGEVKELHANEKANLTRRPFEVEGNMTGQDIDQPSKKVKRSAILNKKIVQEKITDEFISDSSIEFPLPVLITSNINKELNENSVENEEQEDENQAFSLPFIGFPGQKVKRYAIKNNLEKSSEPLYKPKVQFDTRKNTVNNITTQIPLNHEEVNRDLIDIYIPKESTESRLFKRSSPLVKKVHMKKSKQHVKRNKKKSNVFPTKKSQMINVSTNNKLKIHRTKREISSNTSRVIPPVVTALDKQATDSVFDYYKYTVDDLKKASETAGDTHLTEFVEVNSKTTAAKRSIDKQIQGIKIDAHQVTETIHVQGLRENSNDSSTNISDIQAVLGHDKSFKVHPEELQVPKPIDILDNRVVIIEEQNNSSTEKFNQFVSDTILPITKHNFEPGLSDITVIGVKKHENISLNNTNEETNVNITKENIKKKSGIVVDTTIVIINDQNNTLSKNTLPFILNTENNLALYDTTKTNTNKDELFIITTEIMKADENERNLVNVNSPSSELAPLHLINVTIPEEIIHTVFDTSTKYHHELILHSNNDVTGKEKEYQPQQNSKVLDYKRTTKIFNENKTVMTTVKEDMLLLAENNVNGTETNIKQTEHAENTSINGYLQYQVEKKILNTNSNFMTVEKLLEQHNILQNNVSVIKNVKPNYKRKEYQDHNNTLQSLQDFVTTTTIGLAASENNASDIVERNVTTQVVEIIYKSTENPHQLKVKNNDTNKNLSKKKFKSHEMKKVRLGHKKKHELKKLLTTLHSKKNKDEKKVVKNDEGILNISDKINNTKTLKSFFKKILSGFQFNKQANKQSNIRKFKILKYLQLFFKNIFSENKKQKKNKTITTKINKKTVIETLCSTFGPCNNNIKNKAKLQSQLDHLNSETYKMLRTIKKIKGLLKQIDLSSHDKKFSNNTSFRNDVQKLHSILKDSHGELFNNLTPTQKLQMSCIKNNTEDFIHAAAKFSMVLNEIINVITVHKDVNTNLDSYKSRVEINYKNNTNQVIKLRNSNRNITLPKSNESLQKLKELISRYSLLQNTFMRKIYNVLTNLDNSKDSSTKQSSMINSSAVKTNVQNKTQEIQVYTKNIIQNLRKLKNLAQNLNGNTRRKRDVGYDDNLEYFLMLMEFLIKQKSPLDPPVNDGIDLLLEAIKSAPDIKDIKKMAPSYSPVKQLDSMRKSETLLEVPPKENQSKISKENNSTSDSKSSKEDKFSSSSSSNSEDPAFNAINKSFDDDDDEKDYNLFGSKNFLPSNREVIHKMSTKEIPKINSPHCTTESHLTTKTDQKVNNQAKIIEENSNEEFSNKFIEYDIGPANIVTDIEYTSTATTIIEKTSSSTEMTPYFKVNDDISASQSRLDWVDEAYEEETKENSSSTTENSNKAPKHETFDHLETHNIKNKNFTKEVKRSHDVSRLSKEIEDLTSKTKMKEILYKKQLDLLNSLDYGNGKIDPDVSASRESGVIDKYAGDMMGR